MNLARVFADAAGLWQRDRDLWLRVAGFCFFLPALALQLFVSLPDLSGLEKEALSNALVAWAGANASWLAALAVWQVYSCAVVLLLVLDPARPTLGAALVRTLRLMPGLSLAYLAAMLLVGTGASFFIVPGLYLFGRTYLTLPVLVAEPERGPLVALISAIQRSHRRGWLFFLIPLTAFLVQNLVGSVFAAAGGALGAAVEGTPAHLIFGVLLAGVAAAGALAQTLLLAAAYRGITGAKQGI